ncbi:MAG TPA: heavy metal-associated domain-containing protein [Accumulibacter sp.]|nr:heavy metal-associated domain-containing protein [Giesbergeria sp.]HNO72605.1 heavy metal-associated domain-containing protein [Accumulibacter sp.]
MQNVELVVQGMTCGSCVKHVTKALQAVEGVHRVEVDLAGGRVHVEGDLPKGVSPLIAALATEDYPAQLVSGAVDTATPAAVALQPGVSKKSGCCCG